MAHAFEKQTVPVGCSRGVVVPGKWVRRKKLLGVITFDLSDEQDKQAYENLRKQITWR